MYTFIYAHTYICIYIYIYIYVEVRNEQAIFLLGTGGSGGGGGTGGDDDPEIVPGDEAASASTPEDDKVQHGTNLETGGPIVPWLVTCCFSLASLFYTHTRPHSFWGTSCDRAGG
jgi:hypothetical protein